MLGGRGKGLRREREREREEERKREREKGGRGEEKRKEGAMTKFSSCFAMRKRSRAFDLHSYIIYFSRDKITIEVYY